MSSKKIQEFLSTVPKMRNSPASLSGIRIASRRQNAGPASASSLPKVSGQPMDSPSAQLPSAVSSAASVSTTPMQATPAPDTPASTTPASATPTLDPPTQHDLPPDPTLPSSSPSIAPQTAKKIFLYALQEVFTIAKESADWNPFAKAAFGGAGAVLKLLQQTKANKQEVEYLSTQIERLESILSRRMKAGLLSAEWCIESIQKCVDTLTQQGKRITEMEEHTRFRRTLQATRDSDDLLDICRRIKDSFEELQCTVGLAIEHDTSTIRQNAALDKLPISVTAPYNAAIDQTTVSRQSCTKDTRLSILKLILRWISEHASAPVYWLTGPAGVGKTTIAHTICKYIVSPTGEHEHEDLRKRRLVSYFCSHQLDSGETMHLVPTICRRLAEHSSSYARELVRALERDSTLPHAELSDQLEGLLVQPWKLSAAQREGLPHPVVIVDALDENKGGFNFLDLLLKAVDDRKLDGLRFLLTSRTNPEIAERCERFPPGAVCRLQDVPEADVQRDITLYLEASLPKVKDELRRDLAARAGNLFIYASTVVKMMDGNRGAEQDKKIKKILEVTSIGQHSFLDNLYAEIVHGAVYDDDEDIRRDRLRVLHTAVFKLCGSLRSKDLICQLSGAHEDVLSAVVEGLHAVMYTAKNGSILTYHASFPDFILRSPSSFNSPVYLNPLCDESLHHAHLTRRCYEIMVERLHFNTCNLDSSFNLDEDIPDLRGRVLANIDPVLQYAVRYWMAHLGNSRPDEDTLNSIALCDISLAFMVETSHRMTPNEYAIR